MFSNTNINEEELNAKLQKKLFLALVITGCIANFVGFLSNVVLFGMSIPTVICGLCEIVMVICGVAGIWFHRQRSASAAIVLMLAFIEFPFLFYVYGISMGVYLVLGIVALAIYCPRKYQVLVITVTIVLDLTVMILSYFYPCTIEEMDKNSQLATMICSYAIVSVAIAVILRNLIGQYVLQQKHILEVSKELEYAAHRDALTGVYNRGYLLNTLKQWMDMENKHFVVALIDIDNFKKINDTYGHVYGDEVLIELAKLMKQEIQGKGIAARYGGEEFMFLFDGVDKQVALEILERVKEELGEYSMRTKQITITFSGGMEEYWTEREIDEIFHSVDRKLYQAKNDGKNKIVL